MLDAIRVETNIKPNIIESLGDGYYYYNYDIQSKIVDVTNLENETTTQETRWDFVQSKINGTPNYDRCVSATIRSYLSQDEELSMINKYNAYNQGVIQDSSVVQDYYDYISLVQKIKKAVKKDLKLKDPEEEVDLVPRQNDIINLLQMVIDTIELTDEQSVKCKSLYPLWKDFIGKSLSAGKKVTYKGRLYKVKQEVNPVLEIYPPSTDTASLYEEINETNAGTIDDPIPYNNNMELFKGKYYIQNEIKYLCIRNTEQPVYQDLKDLVGNYVQVAEE